MITVPAIRREATGPEGNESSPWLWHTFEIPDAKIKIPYIDEPQKLKIRPWVDYEIVNDNGQWILPSISRELSDEITEWDLLEDLDPNQKYIIRADSDEGPVTLRRRMESP